VTPAHDQNDKILGEKHNLEVIDIFNDDATLNSFGLHYEGKDRFVVRKEIVKELESIGSLVKIEQYLHKVGTSERTQSIGLTGWRLSWGIRGWCIQSIV
jgi:valyl-tRNA synthetase